jgi:hypothetical protein
VGKAFASGSRSQFQTDSRLPNSILTLHLLNEKLK